MADTIKDVVRAFVYERRAQVSQLSSVPIIEEDGYTGYALLGHAHAVLAYNHPGADIHIHRFDGWYNRSQTTSRHLNLLDGWVDEDVPEQYQLPEFVDEYVCRQN